MTAIFYLFYNNWPVLLLASVISIYIWFYLKNMRYNRLFALIPGPPAKYPLLGNFDLFMTNKSDLFVNVVHEVMVNLAKIYSEHGIFKLSLGPFQKVVIFRKDFFEDLLKDNFNIDKTADYQLSGDWLGKGLVINDDSDSWRQRRKLLTPAFHMTIIERFTNVINEKADILIENLTRVSDNECIDISPFIHQCTLDIISETAMGYKMNSQQNQNLDYLEAIERMTETVIERIFKPWLRNDWIFNRTKIGKKWQDDLKIINDLTRRMINERKQYFMENNINNNRKKNKKKLALLDLLLDKHLNENLLTIDNVCDEVKTFIFGGHDTTANTLLYTLYLIGLYPDIQQRLFEELASIVSKNKVITKEHINQMKYLEAVLNESMRIYPAVHFVLRKISRETKLGNYLIPKGTEVNLAISILHMDPDVFPEPHVFNPDRFFGEHSVKSENTFCFVPFSAGPRNCIGQRLALNEMKIILTKILINFRLESKESRDQMKVNYKSTSEPSNGIKCKIYPRNH